MISHFNSLFAFQGFGRPGEFIATQAPLVTTVEHFWSMIWEQEVTSIVMLTNLEENEKVRVLL